MAICRPTGRPAASSHLFRSAAAEATDPEWLSVVSAGTVSPPKTGPVSTPCTAVGVNERESAATAAIKPVNKSDDQPAPPDILDSRTRGRRRP